MSGNALKVCFAQIQNLRVEPPPPLLLTIRGGHSPIIRNARELANFVGIMGGLQPPPIARLKHRDTES